VPPPVPLDLAWLVAQFTALRHDVNLQTKATRNLNDTITQTLKQPSPATLSDDPTRPLLLVLVELADVMANAMVQVRRTQATLAAPAAVPAPAPGFFARLFGMAKPTTAPPDQPKLSTALAGVADGYAMSHRRILQSLEHHGVQPIACVGMPFDPTCMEAVEAVTASGSTSGTVVEEVRAGYRRAGQLFRFAQVKVAR
jgi:molecular chaperone GrpE